MFSAIPNAHAAIELPKPLLWRRSATKLSRILDRRSYETAFRLACLQSSSLIKEARRRFSKTAAELFLRMKSYPRTIDLRSHHSVMNRICVTHPLLKKAHPGSEPATGDRTLFFSFHVQEKSRIPAQAF